MCFSQDIPLSLLSYVTQGVLRAHSGRIVVISYPTQTYIYYVYISVILTNNLPPPSYFVPLSFVH